MFRLNRHTRAGLATIVAVAQLLVVTHTTLVAHTLSASGAIVEHTSKSEAAHEHDSTSWCKEEAHRHVAADALCQVAKTPQSPRCGSKVLGLEARWGAECRVAAGCVQPAECVGGLAQGVSASSGLTSPDFSFSR